jgi:hypothetical protein
MFELNDRGEDLADSGVVEVGGSLREDWSGERMGRLTESGGVDVPDSPASGVEPFKVSEGRWRDGSQGWGVVGAL